MTSGVFFRKLKYRKLYEVSELYWTNITPATFIYCNGNLKTKSLQHELQNLKIFTLGEKFKFAISGFSLHAGQAKERHEIIKTGTPKIAPASTDIRR